MKKQLFFLLFLLGITQSAFAIFNHGSWRWRNDDNDEANASWKAAINTPIEITDISQTIRLRVEVYNTGGAEVSAITSLYCATVDQTDDFVAIERETSQDVNPFVFVDSSNPTIIGDDTPTTQQLSTNSTFFPGVIRTFHSASKPIPHNGIIEHEFVIKPTATIEPGKTYYFRVHKYALSTIKLTTAATLPVKLKSFTAKKTNNGSLLAWNTENEVNNNRFEIERSTDGKKWQVIGKVAGKGDAASYQFEDTNPANGQNYYRLAQYDNDGTLTYSGLATVNFVFGATQISIYPNPVIAQLTVALPDFKGNSVNLKWSDVTGRLLNTTSLNVIDQKAVYTLPAGIGKGVYVVNVTAKDLNYSQKIIVK